MHSLFLNLLSCLPPSFPIHRCIWANDGVRKRGEPPVPADLWCGQAAGLYSRHRSCLLDHPHGLQHLVVQTPQEKEWPFQQLCRHTQRSVHECNSRSWTLSRISTWMSFLTYKIRFKKCSAVFISVVLCLFFFKACLLHLFCPKCCKPPYTSCL